VPELAEVEYYRKQWDPGLRRKVTRVAVHAGKHLFRGTHVKRLVAAVTGATLKDSEARAKLMCFRFSGDLWLGIHLGMTGRLSVEPPDFAPGKHDHLVLFQKTHALVFHDPRMFGRVFFSEGRTAPAWWAGLPPAVTSPEFTLELVRAFLKRRARLAVKAALLVQTMFPGVGNWMADEILWRAKIDPRVLCGKLTAAQSKALWQESREVCRISLETVGVDFSDPPEDWLFHQRWTAKGICPKHGTPLKTATVGGRTTRWCPRCQPR
jgi:formamidopyrimidine-DNA glycosylase